MRSRRVLASFVVVASGAATVVVSSCSESSEVDGADASVDGRESAPPPPGPAPNPPPADAGIDRDADAAKPLVDTCRKTDAGVLTDVWYADPKLCLTVFAADVVNARMLSFAPNGDLFAIQNNLVMWFRDADGDGVVDETASERGIYAMSPTTEPPFTHGLAFSPDFAFLYVSNMTTIYRWPYTPGDRVAPSMPEIVVANIPGAGHDSRTIVFDAKGRLVFHVGSLTEEDFDPAIVATRSMVRRFTIPAVLPAGGLDYANGEVVAAGLRNEVGLTVDPQGRMWGVENGADALGDDNPAEELNLLEPSPTHFFGSPFCYSEFLKDGGLGAGAQWHFPAIDNPRDDTWCRDPANVQRPAGAMPGHWAPLGIVGYAGGSLPYAGDLVVTSHGSAFRSIPNGRVIARARLSGDKVVAIDPIVGHLGADGGLEEGTWGARPVGLTVGPDDAVYITENLGNRILRLGYSP